MQAVTVEGIDGTVYKVSCFLLSAVLSLASYVRQDFAVSNLYVIMLSL
jgi:hypothetical protein